MRMFLLPIVAMIITPVTLWACPAGQYPDPGTGACIDCGDKYFCHDDVRYDCRDVATAPDRISWYGSVVDGKYNATNASSETQCQCEYTCSDERRRRYIVNHQCILEPQCQSVQGFVVVPADCQVGYYATGVHNSTERYTDCTACTNAPANAHYTGVGSVGSSGRAENNCSWACDAGYFRDGNVCRVCPANLGYSVNAAGECVTECAAAYYVPTAGAACTHVALDMNHTDYVDTPHTVKYGDTSVHMLKKCPTTADGKRGVMPLTDDVSFGSSINHCIMVSVFDVSFTATERGNCVATGLYSCIYETHGRGYAPCYYVTGTDGNAIYDKQMRDPVTGEVRRGCVGGSTLTSCDAGWYAAYVTTTSAIQQHPCSPVGTGYYSPDGDLERYPCPEKTATCGYGECAKSIEDCKPYKTIMTSTGVSLMMQPDQRTHPALGLRMPDDGSVWYGQADPGARDGHINIEYGEKPYALINPMDLFIEVGSTYLFLVPKKPTLPY